MIAQQCRFLLTCNSLSKILETFERRGLAYHEINVQRRCMLEGFCSNRSSLLLCPCQGCLGKNGSHETARLEGISQQAEDRCSPPDPQAAPAQHHSSLDEPMPQAASHTDRDAPHEQHDDSLVGRRLGGKQDRGYRDGKPPADAGGTSMAAEPPSHALHQPSKRPSKSVRMRAQRCLEDSSDDCSDGPSHRSQPQVGLASCPVIRLQPHRQLLSAVMPLRSYQHHDQDSRVPSSRISRLSFDHAL